MKWCAGIILATTRKLGHPPQLFHDSFVHAGSSAHLLSTSSGQSSRNAWCRTHQLLSLTRRTLFAVMARRRSPLFIY